MKCHYEVLGVQRDVSDDELKKAYRKLALKWHPDKNLENTEDAKEQFQLVQQAWEVLSDPHERAWYDNHREAILKGGIGDNYKDDSIDLFQYFTTSCYKGYGNDEKGFYMVYRQVFEQLAAEDSEFSKEEDSDEEIPGFGDSNSSYEDVVHKFYSYWQSYSTKRSFAWLDPYDIRNTPNRRVLRLAEKENKKVRDKAKKERNEQVRNLVAFVRKRDKRVQAYAQILADRAKENAKKAQERQKQQMIQRQQEMKNYTESEWSKFSNIEKDLKVIEANLAAEFGEDLNSDVDSEEDENLENNALYCVACNKIFKTQKAFTNHENSKKHRDNFSVMKASLLNEDKDSEDSTVELNSDSDSDSNSNSDINKCTSSLNKKLKDVKLATGPEMSDFLLNPNVDVNTNVESEQESTSDGEMLSDYESNSKKQKKKRKVLREKGIKLATGPEMEDFLDVSNKVPKIEDDENAFTSEDELISDQEVFDDTMIEKLRKTKKKKSKSVQKVTLEQTTDDEQECDIYFGLSKKQRRKQIQKRANLDKLFSIVKESTDNIDEEERIQTKDETIEDTVDNRANGSHVLHDNDNSDLNSEGDSNTTNLTSSTKKSKGKKAKDARKVQKQSLVDIKTRDKKGKKDATVIEDIQNFAHCCVTCKVEFPTKNKLFDHLKKTGHSVYIPELSKSKKNVVKASRSKKQSSKDSD